MKAILTQWIGSSKGNSEIAGSAKAKALTDSASAEKQSFMGLMMGFLGMNSQPETPAPAVQHQQSLLLSGEAKAGAGPRSFPGIAMLSSPNVDGISEKSVEPNKAAGSSTLDILQKNTHPALTKTDAEKVLQKTAPTNSNLSGETKQTLAKTTDNPNGAAPKTEGTQKSTNWIGQNVQQTEAQQKHPIAKTPLIDKKGIPVGPAKKESPQQPKPDISRAGQNHQPTESKNVTKTGFPAQKIKKPTNTANKMSVQPDLGNEIQKDTKTKTQIPETKQYSTNPLITTKTASKPNTNSGVTSFVPGELTSSLHELDLQMDGELSKEHSGEAEQPKEFYFNNLKSSQLHDAVGRKSFSKQLAAQVSRQQFSQSQASTRQTSQWKHHRFVLKDGSSIHIAARSTDGSLQLQLNAGNRELGKIIQQHLSDIQQHVQQELDIKIDLQLQHFGGQQTGQQTGDPSGAASQNGSPNFDGDGSGGSGVVTSTRQQVRYLGFNKNEWTA